MNASGIESEDKVVVDPVDVELPGQRGTQAAIGRAEQPRGIAKGTREQVVVVCPLGATATRAPAHSDLERDAVQVLRTWPHSTVALDPHAGAARRAAVVSPSVHRVDDKIALAHLALDLYREIEQLEDVLPRGHASHTGDAVCTSQACVARINALRGALLEACLLVQRVAMAPTVTRDLEDRIRDLLDVLER